MLDLLKKYYLIIIGVLFIVILIIYSFNTNDGDLVFDPIIHNEVIEEKIYIYIDIKGEVNNPGVYKVVESSRLFQVISLAGGTTMDADILAFNLSMILTDEQVVYIPSIFDEYPIITESINENEQGVININTASLQDLDTLPGIGPSTAQSIIDFREENGSFSSVEDIVLVPGIGEATLNEIIEFITV